jgi:pimeloyl-ACP methyl ester carboxylesterase
MKTPYDLFIPSSDGVRLHLRVHEPDGRPRGNVICLPGLTRDWRDFEPLAAHLAGEGYRVAALDFRGRGLSAHDANAMHYHIPYEAIDTLQALAALNMTQAHFIGTSRGGMVTMYLATIAREKILSATLNDIGPVLEMAGLMRIASYVGKARPITSWEEVVASLQRTNPGFESFSSDDWMQFAKATCVERDGQLVTLYDPAIGHVFSMIDPSKPFPTLWPWYDALQGIRTLIIRGENSDLLSNATCAEMLAHNSAAKLVIAEGEAHAPMLGRDRLKAEIGAFLSAH